MAAKKQKKTSAALASQPDPKAPLDSKAFLAAAQRVLASLRDDLLARADASPGVTEALRAQWHAESEAKRTGDGYDVWRRRVVVQIAAAWVLSLVFARTLEDRGLVERNRIAGPGAADSQEQFRAIAPYLTERDYLLTVFRELSNLAESLAVRSLVDRQPPDERDRHWILRQLCAERLGDVGRLRARHAERVETEDRGQVCGV